MYYCKRSTLNASQSHLYYFVVFFNIEFLYLFFYSLLLCTLLTRSYFFRTITGLIIIIEITIIIMSCIQFFVHLCVTNTFDIINGHIKRKIITHIKQKTLFLPHRKPFYSDITFSYQIMHSISFSFYTKITFNTSFWVNYFRNFNQIRFEENKKSFEKKVFN